MSLAAEISEKWILSLSWEWIPLNEINYHHQPTVGVFAEKSNNKWLFSINVGCPDSGLVYVNALYAAAKMIVIVQPCLFFTGYRNFLSMFPTDLGKLIDNYLEPLHCCEENTMVHENFKSDFLLLHCGHWMKKACLRARYFQFIMRERPHNGKSKNEWRKELVVVSELKTINLPFDYCPICSSEESLKLAEEVRSKIPNLFNRMFRTLNGTIDIKQDQLAVGDLVKTGSSSDGDVYLICTANECKHTVLDDGIFLEEAGSIDVFVASNLQEFEKEIRDTRFDILSSPKPLLFYTQCFQFFEKLDEYNSNIASH